MFSRATPIPQKMTQIFNVLSHILIEWRRLPIELVLCCHIRCSLHVQEKKHQCELGFWGGRWRSHGNCGKVKLVHTIKQSNYPCMRWMSVFLQENIGSKYTKRNTVSNWAKYEIRDEEGEAETVTRIGEACL